jgi:hypothetical protein
MGSGDLQARQPIRVDLMACSFQAGVGLGCYYRILAGKIFLPVLQLMVLGYYYIF